MLGLFKVAVDNFMNIRLEAFQKRGGPRYDAQHAGTVSLISNVDGTDAQTRSMRASAVWCGWVLEITKHTQPTSWFQAASKEWELQVFNPVRMQSLHLVLSTSLSTWKSAPSEGNLWWAHFWTQRPAVLGDGVLLRLWLGWKGQMFNLQLWP